MRGDHPRHRPRVSISSLKVLGDGRSGSAAALISGLAFAIEEGFDVISMSLSTTRVEFRDRLTELCDRAYFRRTTVVAAAHNLPIESFPWNFSSVISVASHAEPDGMRFYYNPAPPVEFRARGCASRWRAAVAEPCGAPATASPHRTWPGSPRSS
ncbi:S8 family serine peptidase [Streptomyces nojiriensis]